MGLTRTAYRVPPVKRLAEHSFILCSADTPPGAILFRFRAPVAMRIIGMTLGVEGPPGEVTISIHVNGGRIGDVTVSDIVTLDMLEVLTARDVFEARLEGPHPVRDAYLMFKTQEVPSERAVLAIRGPAAEGLSPGLRDGGPELGVLKRML